MPYYINGPDGHSDGSQGIFKSEEGTFTSFKEAKAAMLVEIDTKIWALKEYKKELKSMRKADEPREREY
jgi:hypothetical protein